jgi:hypothetical protein
MLSPRLIVTFLASFAVASLAVAQDATPKFTVGEPHIIPVLGKKTYYVNDSVFPLLPAKDGKGVIAFWGDAIVMRYTGPDLDHLTPPANDEVVKVTPTPGVSPDWHRNGGWMLSTTRLPDGSLVAFVHGEDHEFADGLKGGEWNSTGVWTSNDDGVSWIDHGEAVGSQKPAVHQTAGMAMNETIWDPVNQRWIGYNSRYVFISKDPHALPGTWFGYKDGKFSEPVDVNAPMPPLTPAPGLEHANVTWGGLTYNSYLKKFVRTWGNGDVVMIAFSNDCVTWFGVSVLFKTTEPKTDISYPFLLGETSTSSGQDCQLIYMFHPVGKTVSGHIKDMISRPVHFE